MNVGPTLVVLPHVKCHEIKPTEALADLAEVRAVAAVAAEEEPPPGCFQRKGDPQGLVTREHAARVVPRRQNMDAQAGHNLQHVVPVCLVYAIRWVAPPVEVFPDAQPNDDLRDLGQQCDGTGIVQVVPVIVRDQQHVDGGHILGRVRRRPRECHVGAGERPGVGAEYRIKQDALAVQLHEVRGMAQPHHHVLTRWQSLEVDTCGWERSGGFEVGVAVEQHRDHVGCEAGVLCAHRRVDEVLEYPIHIVRRTLDR
ncbi:hypothetical protein D3C72_1508910 [compost metagenome]